MPLDKHKRRKTSSSDIVSTKLLQNKNSVSGNKHPLRDLTSCLKDTVLKLMTDFCLPEDICN
ncbi:hypothetical protein ACQP3C_28255, partial [Escherichia coli]